jgi:MFS family permease
VRRWIVVAFLMFFMAISFADKAILGLSAGPIMSEFHLTYAQFGAIGSSFFLLFSFSALGVGLLGDRVGPNRLLTAMAVVWTIAQISVAAASAFAALLGSRVLLGAGEGPAAPTALHVAYETSPEAQQPRVSGIILAGSPLGAALAALLLPRMVFTYGWRVAFVLLGAASIFWVAAWILLAPRKTFQARTPTKLSPLAMWALVGNRPMIGVMLATFAAYWATAVAIVWFPKFLAGGAGFSAQSSSSLLTVAWSLQVPVFIVGGFAAELTARRTGLSNQTYRGFAAAAVGATGLAFVGLSFSAPPPITSLLICVALISVVVTFAVSGPIVTGISPPSQWGTALGSVVAIYALAGVAAPFTFGALVDRSRDAVAGYHLAFRLAGCAIALAAAIAFVLMRQTRGRRATESPPS